MPGKYQGIFNLFHNIKNHRNDVIYSMIKMSTFFYENHLNFVIYVELCNLLNMVNKTPVFLNQGQTKLSGHPDVRSSYWWRTRTPNLDLKGGGHLGCNPVNVRVSWLVHRSLAWPWSIYTGTWWGWGRCGWVGTRGSHPDNPPHTHTHTLPSMLMCKMVARHRLQ